MTDPRFATGRRWIDRADDPRTVEILGFSIRNRRPTLLVQTVIAGRSGSTGRKITIAAATLEAKFTLIPLDEAVTDRQRLIDLATRGVVPVEHWSNRDSSAAQMQLGEVRALLAAGCDFTYDPTEPDDGETHWVTIDYPGFNAFEEGRHDTSTWDDHTFYIPTADRLDRANGKDWY